MPGFDGTGPRGEGAMTGGGRGYCVVGWNGVRRRGGGFGSAPRWGGGFGWRNAPAYDEAPPSSVDALAAQIGRLAERLDALNARLDAHDRSER